MILVVDDDLDVLQTTSMMMRNRGFEILTATNGPEALELCRRFRGQIDAVVADLSIPGDHSNFTHTVAVEHPNIKIIYVSGIPRHIALSSGLVEPEAPYVEKPVSPDVLESLIRGQVTGFIPARDIW
ncbi:response regulator [Actinoplanes sp. NPDC049265]|uniref:response regulator n=1 Tax=Actinoplanes sp. NPDC049265 TaxID=3363902 RepID=UPI00371949BB